METNSALINFAPLPSHELIDCRELARRWNLPESWVRDQVRRRSPDPIPHIRCGKYVRFRSGSPELEAWVERRIIGPNNGNGAGSSKERKQ